MGWRDFETMVILRLNTVVFILLIGGIITNVWEGEINPNILLFSVEGENRIPIGCSDVRNCIGGQAFQIRTKARPMK